MISEATFRKILACLTPDARLDLARTLGVEDETYGRSKTDMLDLFVDVARSMETGGRHGTYDDATVKARTEFDALPPRKQAELSAIIDAAYKKAREIIDGHRDPSTDKGDQWDADHPWHDLLPLDDDMGSTTESRG